jgi:predicted transcriptional regulator
MKDVLQKVFRGSVDDLLLTLVRDKHVNARKLAELQARLEASNDEEDAQ